MSKREKDVLSSMFLPAAIVMIFTQVTGVVANIIDGVITSRFLGSDAYSAVSLLGPMVNIILLLASFISIGGQIVCAHKVGTGEREEANAVFSFSVYFGIFIAVLFVIFSIFCPDVLFRICGVSVSKRPDLYSHMLNYLHGYLIGIPAVILVQVLSPFLVMDNGKKLVTLSAAVLCITDILGDLLNAFLFHGGIFGMGLATSVSMWLQLAVLLIHFFRRSGYFRFSLKALNSAHIKSIVKNGSLSGNEPMLIDMDTVSVGDPVFDLMGLYLSYVQFGEDDPDDTVTFLGLSAERCRYIWKETLRNYLDCPDEAVTEAIEKKIIVVALIRFLYLIAGLGIGKPQFKQIRIEHALSRLGKLAQEVDSLKIAER